MPQTVPIARIEPFAGTDERWALTPEKTALLRDLEWDGRGGWERSGGIGQLLTDAQGNNPFSGQGAIQSLHWYSQHNGGPQYLIGECGTKLFVVNFSDRSLTILRSNRYVTSQPWQRTQYCSVNGNCWIVNGYNEPLRFDGLEGAAHRAGYDGPPPPPIVEGFADGFIWGTTYHGIGLGTAGTADQPAFATPTLGTNGGGYYGYLLTEVNEFGTESPPSPTFAAVGWRIDSSALTPKIALPKYFAKVRYGSAQQNSSIGRWLYRTQNAQNVQDLVGAPFFRCMWLPGAGEGVYVDAIPDSNLGDPLDATKLGIWPRGAKYMVIYKGVPFFAGMPYAPDSVVAGRPGLIEGAFAGNSYTVGDSDSGEITGLRVTRGALMVFKRRGVFYLMGDPTRGWDVRELTKQTGCAAPNSIREVPGVGLVFASEDDVWALTGSLDPGDTAATVTRLTETLPDTWRWRINKTAMMNAWGAVNHKKREYWLSLPIDGTSRNQLVFAYLYPTGQWVQRPDLNAACMVETADHRREFYIGSNASSAHPGVWVYSGWFTDKDGVAIVPRLETVWLDLHGVYEHSPVKLFVVRALQYGSAAPLLVYAYQDRRPTPINTAGQSRAQFDADYQTSRAPVYGTAVWSATALWSQATPTVYRFDIEGSTANGTRGSAKEWKFAITCNGRMQILGAQVEVAPPGVKRLGATNPTLGGSGAQE